MWKTKLAKILEMSVILYVNRISRKIKWSLLLSRTSKPVVTPTTHEPGFFHNIKLNNLSIKELRSLRQIGSKDETLD
jgi:hypothetical protein